MLAMRARSTAAAARWTSQAASSVAAASIACARRASCTPRRLAHSSWAPREPVDPREDSDQATGGYVQPAPNATNFRHLRLLTRKHREGEASGDPDFLQASRHAWLSDPAICPSLHRHLRAMHAALAADHTAQVFERWTVIQRDASIKGLHVEVFNAMLQACVKLKQPEAAVATFDAMFQHNLRPNFFSYIFVVDALLDHHDMNLAFDFLVMLHREFDASLLEGWNGCADPAMERFMHSRLLKIHTVFLMKLGHIGAGYHGSRQVNRGILDLEVFVKDYMLAANARMSKEMDAVVEKRVAARTAAGVDTPRSFRDVLTQEDLVELTPIWRLIQDNMHSLFAHAVTRNDLAKATQLWDSLHGLRKDWRWSALIERESLLAEEIFVLDRYVSLLISLNKIHHRLDEIPNEDQVGYTERAEIRINKAAGIVIPQKPEKTIPQWHLLRDNLYAEFWGFMRNTLHGRERIRAGKSQLEVNEMMLCEVRESKAARRKLKEQLHAILPPSHAEARIAAHRAEPIDIEDEEPSTSGRITLQPTGAPSSSGETIDLFSIDTLVESLAQQNKALKATLADSEPALRSIEGRSPSEVASALSERLGRQYDEEDSEDAAIADLDEEDEELRADAMNRELEAGLADAHRRSDSRERKMPPLPARHVPRPPAAESPLSRVRGASLLPPIDKPLLSPLQMARLNHLYRAMLSSLLLYGSAAASRRVTPGSYRRNQELVHALYYDYLSLDLSRPDPRILMLAHLSHAPPEFHIGLVQDADWLAPRGAQGLVSRLFGAQLVGPPASHRNAIGQLESQAERLNWFARLWHAHHVHEWSAASRGSDLAFRKRTYRLIEELSRRGLSPQSARDGMLHFLIKCLSFTSYSSRPDGEELLAQSFDWRRQNLYDPDLAHVRRVLRVLFSLILQHGVTVDVPTLNELIKACLSHHRLVEAHAILQHMRHTFHLQPDVHTTNLFLEYKYTPNHARAAQRMLADIDANLQEVIRAPGTRKAVGSTVIAGDDEHALTASNQMLEALNNLLQQYQMSRDTGLNMLTVHERIFSLGLAPSSRTLVLSLTILLGAPNSVSFGRARELFLHASSPTVRPLAEGGFLAQFVSAMEEARHVLREKEKGARERVAEIAKRAARDAHAEASQAALAAGLPLPVVPLVEETIPLSQDIHFDPLAAPIGANVAVPFSYETWHGIHITTKAWRVLIEGAEAIGSWVDVWSLYCRYMADLSTLNSDDRRAHLFLNPDRMGLFASVLRSVVHHTPHLAPSQQMWYFETIHQTMGHFFLVPAHLQIPSTSEVRLNFTLEDEELKFMLLPSDLALLQRWAQSLEKGFRTIAPPDENETAVKRVEQILATRRASADRQGATTGSNGRRRDHVEENHRPKADFAFL